MKYFKLYYTVKELEPIQILYRIKYIFKRKYIEKFGTLVFDRIEKSFNETELKISIDSGFLLNDRKYYRGSLEEVLENKITFLNKTISFEKKINWHLDDLNKGTRLWKLNLNYHEFLFDIALEYKASHKKEYLSYIETTISEWSNQNPLGTEGYGKDNWNSYALSLRIISWIKLYALIGNEFSKQFEERFIKLLWIQSIFLKENLEFDILGNHLIKNWKALIWCEQFFNSDIFRKKILYLEKFIYNQFSSDCMHEEFSPMYAGIVLEDLMEVYVFENQNKRLGKIIKQLYSNINFLTFGSDYSFFNDSVINNGVQVRDLRRFYGKIFKDDSLSYNGIFNIDGFIGSKNKNQHFIIDFAKVINGNQPGHLHCDALSFEFSLNSHKIFTNSGTFEYNSGEKRRYSRSTRSHNTLEYGNFEQSEIWSSFRVARKADVIYTIHKFDETIIDIEGSVTGFDFKNKVTHKRRFIKTKNKIQIRDVIIAHKEGQDSRIFYHLNENLIFRDSKIINQKSNEILATVKANLELSVVKTEFYPGFEKILEKETIIIDSIKPNFEVQVEILYS